jgi:enoyl-CoA hydratase/carnithine racemase
MAYENLVVDREGNIGIITLNRPPANPINLALLDELDTALSQWEKDKAVRAIIITGAGDKGFSAGLDVKAAQSAEGDKVASRGHDVFKHIERYPRPVIAAVNGFALGGGCELALSCHFRIMVNSERAVIGLPEIGLGLMPGWGGTQRLPRLVGKTKALEMLLFGARLNASDALAIGLMSKVSQPGQLMDDAKEFARTLAKKAPIAMQTILDTVTRGLDTNIDEGLKIELEAVQQVQKTKDAREGMAALIEKREPVFIGE